MPDPAMFDAFRLVREGRVLTGKLDVGASERMEDRVAAGSDTVEWRIAGTTDFAGRPALEIAIDGNVLVTCQRCLADFAMPVTQRTIAVLAKSEADADALDADSDMEVLVADRMLDAEALVEDELLLTLPYAPRHDACEADAGSSTPET